MASNRPVLLFAALGVLVAVAIAGSYFLGMLGPVEWKSIDGVRLLAPVLFFIAILVVSARARLGLMPQRRVLLVCAVAVVVPSGILSNTTNIVVEIAVGALVVLAAGMAATMLVLDRKAKATAA
jgi:hypothetical protein